MKNFPHQYNKLSKIRATLQVVSDLADRGANVADDGVLGEALAEAGVYNFRPNIDPSGSKDQVLRRVRERLKSEKTKPEQNQGFRTAAREARRTLGYLGFTTFDGIVTQDGLQLLKTAPGSEPEATQFRKAVLGIELEDGNGNKSHPTQILLAVVDQANLDRRSGMEVALEAKDDSQSEINRVVKLARLPEDDRRAELLKLGWSTSQIDNARKIIPAWAVQVGLITEGASTPALTPTGTSVINAQHPITTGGTSPNRGSRSRKRSGTSQNPTTFDLVGRPPEPGDGAITALSAADQAAARERLAERSSGHQRLVRDFAKSCGPVLYEDPWSFDLIVAPTASNEILLAEMKTIDGDAEAQVRRSVGQLTFYRHFHIPDQLVGRDVRIVMIADERLDDELADYLSELGIGLIARETSGFVAQNQLGQEALDKFRADS